MSRESEFVKNRAKTTRKMPSAGKSTCISGAILTCFASGRTLASLAMGRPIRGFHRAPHVGGRRGAVRRRVVVLACQSLFPPTQGRRGRGLAGARLGAPVPPSPQLLQRRRKRAVGPGVE